MELKQLAGYLPYGLKMYYALSDDTWILDIDNIDFITKHDKPILRPLSDLTKEICYGLSTYVFTGLFEIGVFDKVSTTTKIRTIPINIYAEKLTNNQTLKKASL